MKTPTHSKNDPVPQDTTLKLELSASTLLSLIESGQICVNDFRCLDCESKYCVRELVLRSCAKQVHDETRNKIIQYNYAHHLLNIKQNTKAH